MCELFVHRFDDSRFRNSWNAVYVAGAWRFVQCNWGARHLVNAKEASVRSMMKKKPIDQTFGPDHALIPISSQLESIGNVDAK